MGDRTYRGILPGEDGQSTPGGMRSRPDWSMMSGDREHGGPPPGRRTDDRGA